MPSRNSTAVTWVSPAALAAPLLAELTPAQIEGLERKFQEEEAAEAKEDRDSVRHRERKRAKRYANSAEWWIGPSTKPQRTIVADVTAAMPDTARAWETYRESRRAALIRLLREHPSEAQIRRFLTNWLVEYRGLPRDCGGPGWRSGGALLISSCAWMRASAPSSAATSPAGCVTCATTS